jgi:hypothetical protein
LLANHQGQIDTVPDRDRDINKTESIEGKRKNDRVTERENHRIDRTRHRGREAGKLRSFSFSHE